MAHVKGRPMPPLVPQIRAVIRNLDTQQHPQHNIPTRTVQPINYSPLGPSTRHVAAPLKPHKLK